MSARQVSHEDRQPLTIDRRRFLQLSAASMAMAAGGCDVAPPEEDIIPYVRAPEHLVLGRPQWYASSFVLRGIGHGVLVESHQGRPTKIEGNPEHPASLGGTDPFMQAAVLSLYDPERSQAVYHRGRPSSWDQALAAVREALKTGNGAGLRILTGSITSPMLLSELNRLLEALPEARWHVFEPVGRRASYEGARMAFGKPLETRYDLSRADVILSLDSDFLS